ncbi:MAG: sodium:calcium antiporter [Gemmatimonadaceae bacterium]|nr:sodium:calcium antiporter [Gemmatimonadaceae bacterium]
MLIQFLIFAGSLAALIGAARYFTRAADTIGLAFGMSPFAVGVLLVAAGTSLPELSTSLLAAGTASSDIVAGNVLGASIANLLLALGVVAIAAPAVIVLGERYLFIDLNFLIGSAALLGLAMLDGALSRVDGVVLLSAYVVYVFFLLTEGRTTTETRVDAMVNDVPARGRIPWSSVGILLVSGAAIVATAGYTVGALEQLALGFGVAPGVVAVTLLSIGTTLPETVTSTIAARSGQADVAIGNILGSCIFNALAVAGSAAVAGGVQVPPSILGLPLIMYAIAVVLFYLLTQDKRVSRYEGALFLLLFGLFVAKMAGAA